jgi:catechol 2,3-dioxygenase-like lactoylglutathione lyase family enzyme
MVACQLRRGDARQVWQPKIGRFNWRHHAIDRMGSMRLAKPRFDIGLATNNLEPMLRFWRETVGAPFDHLLPIRRGHDQYRHDLSGSVLKINHMADPLPATSPTGYRELLIAKEGLEAPLGLVDPDGNLVRLVPVGAFGVSQIGVRLIVRDLAAERRFYAAALGLAEEASAAGAAYRAGEGLILIEQADDAPLDTPFDGGGWRYLTFQVFGVDSEHARVLANGGREALAPVTLGTTARISMVKDPAGNWIEISQRASITGSLEPG